ncbi:hypothetical protein KAR28_02220 [Candidatus Parcubacteria bacterium]|nr:hypothetical protein [Candidatus Parcubacteria bacterium]
MYIKKLQKIIIVAVISAVISVIAGFWIFEMDWPFLPFPLLAGLIIVFVQKEKISYKFLDKLFIGALIFGFSTSLLIFTRMYLFSVFIYDADFPFWPLYNPKEYLIFSLVFSFVNFIGGLAGIVLKGFYSIIQSHNQQKASKNFK